RVPPADDQPARARSGVRRHGRRPQHVPRGRRADRPEQRVRVRWQQRHHHVWEGGMSNALAVTGWGVVSSVGVGAEAFGAAWRAGRSGLRDVSGMYAEPLPVDKACAVTDFNVREHLGRKGTGFFDRTTSLAVVTCGLAIADANLPAGDDDRGGTGLVLG